MKAEFSKKLMAIGTAVLFGLPVSAQGGGTPSVASLDFCADQYVLAFTGAERIEALSKDATGPLSFYRERAQGLPQTRASAEEVLMLQADLVVRTYQGSAGLDGLLKRLGVAVHQPSYAFDFASHLGNLQGAADALGAPDAGRAVVVDLKARYDALLAAPKFDAAAVYLTPSGTTAGEGSAVADIIALAGFRSFATDIGIRGWATLPLEEVVMGSPDLVIGSFFEEGTVNRSSWSLSRHGVFRRLVDDLPAIMVPSRLMSCSVAQAVDAAEHIRTKALAHGFTPNLTQETAR